MIILLLKILMIKGMSIMRSLKRLYRMYHLQFNLLKYLLKGKHVNKYRVKEQIVVLLLLPVYVKSWLLNKTVKNKHLNALRASSNDDILYQLTKEDVQC